MPAMVLIPQQDSYVIMVDIKGSKDHVHTVQK